MGRKFILFGPDYDENFGFHLREDVDDGLDELIGQMQNAVLSLAPETVVYEKGDIVPEGMEGRWFEYKSFTLDEETYNVQFAICSGNHLLAGTFNCRMEAAEELLAEQFEKSSAETVLICEQKSSQLAGSFLDALGKVFEKEIAGKGDERGGEAQYLFFSCLHSSIF